MIPARQALIIQKKLYCSACFKNGKKQILAEIVDEKSVAVLRFHRSATLITGNFTIGCGFCGSYLSKFGGDEK